MKIEAAQRLKVMAAASPAAALKFFRKLGLKVDKLPSYVEDTLPTAGGFANASNAELLGSRVAPLKVLTETYGQPKRIKKRNENQYAWTIPGGNQAVCYVVSDDPDTVAYLRLAEIKY
jgi:hypothetical protein